MKIVYTEEKPPECFSKSIFLAGPTPRSKEVASWRPQALKILERLSYEGVVFVPEYRDIAQQDDSEGLTQAYINQTEWEEACLRLADCILFWLPREIKNMPGFTTNTEWGVWQNSGKVVFGAPPNAEKVKYQRYYATKLKVPNADTLEETVRLAIKLIGERAPRTSR